MNEEDCYNRYGFTIENLKKEVANLKYCLMEKQINLSDSYNSIAKLVINLDLALDKIKELENKAKEEKKLTKDRINRIFELEDIIQTVIELKK